MVHSTIMHATMVHAKNYGEVYQTVECGNHVWIRKIMIERERERERERDSTLFQWDSFVVFTWSVFRVSYIRCSLSSHFQRERLEFIHSLHEGLSPIYALGLLARSLSPTWLAPSQSSPQIGVNFSAVLISLWSVWYQLRFSFLAFSKGNGWGSLSTRRLIHDSKI